MPIFLKKKRAKLDAVSFQRIFVDYHSSIQVKVFNSKIREINWHTTVKFLEDISGDKFLKIDEKEKKEETLIFTNEDEDENEKNENAQNQNFEQNAKHLAPDDTELMKNELVSSTNHKNRENQMTLTNQTARKSGRRKIPNQSTRRSARLTKPFSPYQFDNEYGRNATKNSDPPSDQKFEPSTYYEVTTCQDQRLWKTIINDQLNALIANQIWKLIDRSSDVENIITSKWIFKVKYTSTGHIDRYKARLVVRGFSQMQNIDFEKTFSSILKLESFRMLLAFSAHFDYEVKQLNVSDAYLKKDLKKTIYMKISDDYAIQKGDQSNDLKILKLFRPLYGLKQSGREWNLKAKEQFRTMKFRTISSDFCVFLNKFEHIILALYVDDLLIFSQSADKAKTVKK